MFIKYISEVLNATHLFTFSFIFIKVLSSRKRLSWNKTTFFLEKKIKYAKYHDDLLLFIYSPLSYTTSSPFYRTQILKCSIHLVSRLIEIH